MSRPPRDISLDSVLPELNVDLSDFFGTTSISFVVADAKKPDMPIVYVNRAFELTTGYSHSFVVGRNCRFLQGPDTDREAVRNIAIALSRGQGVNQTLLNYRSDGSTFINDLVITPINDKDGETAYFVGVQREIGQDAAEADEVLRRRTIDIVRQQVQLHLSVVMEMSRLHMAEAGHPSDADSPVSFRDLLRRLEVLDLLYENISQTSLAHETLDVGAYVSQIVAKLVARKPKAGVRVNIRTESVIVPLDVAVRIGVILAELIDNALENGFSGTDGGELDVALQTEDDQYELIVYTDGQSGGSDDADEPESDAGADINLRTNELTLKVIQRLLTDINSELDRPSVDQGFAVRVYGPVVTRPAND